MLPSKEELRESIIRRLTAVSDDICSAFQRTVDGYKTELSRQRRLIDVVWNPNIRIHVSDLQLLCDDVLIPAQRRALQPIPQPGPSQQREPQPSSSQQREPQPGPSQQRAPQPGPSQQRAPQPGPSQQRAPQPSPSQQRELQPGPSQQNHEHVEDPGIEYDEPERYAEPGSGKWCVDCHVCGKSFKLTFQLKRHMRLHTDKPYCCPT